MTSEKVKKHLEQLKAFYVGLSVARKVALAVSLLLVLGIFAGLVLLGTRQDWRPLLNDGSAEEVQAVVQSLKKANIPCRVSAAGNTVEVPAAHIDQARMEVASSNLLRNGAGYELFDRNDYGQSSFQEQVNYRRALEGELARTIRSLAEIRGARVHLVLPRQVLFREDRVEPSASVVVNLRPGRKLSEKQIRGIRALVASAVEGMQPGRVAVLDQQGALLARQQSGENEVYAAEKLEFQQHVERALESRVLALLEPLVGPGKAVVQVTAEVDLQRVKETDEQFDPDASGKRSEQTNQEYRGQAEQIAEGIPGARSNLPGGEPGRTAREGVIFERNQKTVNYEISKKVRQVEYGAADIKRLSAAVVVDGSYLREGEGDKAKMVYRPRSSDEMKMLESLVKKAIGFDPARGDQVEVTNLAFESGEEPEGGTSWLGGIDITRLVQMALMLVGGVLLVLFVLRPLLRPLWQKQPIMVSAAGVGASARTISEPLLAGMLEGGNAQLPAPAVQGESTEAERQQLQAMGLAARRLADEQQERTIQLIRNWLSEDLR